MTPSRCAVTVRKFFEDEWSGQLLINKRVEGLKKEKLHQGIVTTSTVKLTSTAKLLNGNTETEKVDGQEEEPLTSTDLYVGLQMEHSKHGRGKVQVRCSCLT